MKNQSFVSFTLVLLIIALAACSSAPGAPAGGATVAPAISTAPVVTLPPAPTGAAPASPPVPTQPSAAATPAPKTAPAGVAVPFPNPKGLEQLNSYEMSLRVSFKGTRDTQSVQATDIYTRSWSPSPGAQFTTIQTAGDSGQPTVILQGLVGDVQYIGRGQSCTARTVTPASARILNPAVMLRPFYQGKEVGAETVNGLPARHYVMETIRNSDTEMSGEVWIAEKNAFVVKYALRIKGGEQYFGKGNQGEQTLAYELRDVGTKKTVAIPNGCLPPITDLPAMPDAVNAKRSLLELSYTTASDMAKTLAFYQEQMKARGWTMETTSVMAQPQASAPSIPNMPQLPQMPGGVNIAPYLPTPVPGVGAPTSQNSWLVFRLSSEQRKVYIKIQPQGANLQVLAEIVQE